MDLDKEINFDTLKKYLVLNFPNREQAPDNRVYDLLYGLQENFINDYPLLDSVVNKHLEWFLEYEKNYTSRGGDKFHDVDVITGLLYLEGMDLPDIPFLIRLRPYRKYVKND